MSQGLTIGSGIVFAKPNAPPPANVATGREKPKVSLVSRGPTSNYNDAATLKASSLWAQPERQATSYKWPSIVSQSSSLKSSG